HSSLTEDTCPQLADAFTAAGLGQPNQNISNYTLFEIAYAAFQLVDNPHDKTALAAALFQVKLPQAIAGPVDYTATDPHTNPAPLTPPPRRRHPPAGRHPVAEGHQVPPRGQDRRQPLGTAGAAHRRPAADQQIASPYRGEAPAQQQGTPVRPPAAMAADRDRL